MTDIGVTIGGLALKNPVIAGAGEHTITSAGVRAALKAGCAAVVMKSTNESKAAKAQLDGTDYVLLDSHWKPLPWDFNAPRDAQLFGRSGLIQEEFDSWLARAVELDAEAKAMGAILVPSLILADLDQCVIMAKAIEAAGLRVLELNIGAPHGEEAAKGAIVLERAASRVREITATLRAAIRIPIWLKLTGQSEDVAALAIAAREGGADAVIMMGRFMGFVPDLDTRAPMLGTSAAIGGPWALALTCRWLALTRRKMGKDFPLLGTNGARDGHDVLRFLLAGATAVEMTSAILTNGFGVLSDAVRIIEDYCRMQGVNARDLIGEAADKLATYGDQKSRPGVWRTIVPPEVLD